MATLISGIEGQVRLRLNEITPRFWTSAELTEIIIAGIRDLWRDIADLKQEHYLTVDETNVFLDANSSQLSGVPVDVHKVVMIAPRDLTTSSTNGGLMFKPVDFNSDLFQSSKGRAAIDATNDVICYAITAQGSPVAAPVIRTAPEVTSVVNLSFAYVPTLGPLTSGSTVPIPGEADNALVAWTVAFARAKESEDRSPDANWLSIFATEKQHLLQSLGLRQYQEPTFVSAMYEEYW
jgi:hypothetical protein